MGTGSGGGAGSGGSGGGGAGRGGGGSTYTSARGEIVSNSLSAKAAAKMLGGVFGRIQKSNSLYFDRQFTGPLVRGAFLEMVGFWQCLRSADPKVELLRNYGVPEGPAFLRRWTEKVLTPHLEKEKDSRLIDAVRQCVGQVLLKIVSDNLQTFIRGTCADVVARADREVLAHLTDHFLGSHIWQVVSHDTERPGEDAELALKNQCGLLAVRIIDSADELFFTDKIKYFQIFDIIAAQPDWFRRQMRAT